MSRTTATTCDGCGRQQAISTEDIYEGKQGDRELGTVGKAMLEGHSTDG